MMNNRIDRWVCAMVVLLSLLKTEAYFVGITYLESAVARGAVCLDGSPPAYHFDRGFGAGVDRWLVHIEGGGWCNNATTCLERKSNRLGSSKQMVKELAFSGILSNKENFNPDFYNWNKVKVRYCDGASFTGDVEAVNPATNLHYRGARIFVAVIEDLLAKGMQNAEYAILSGCSAGGLTSILHCDNFRALIPIGTKVKCLSDAGYFINAKDVSRAEHIQGFYSEVVATHGSAKNLPISCTSRMSPGLCFFPQNIVEHIRTPLFITNAAYDSWQVISALSILRRIRVLLMKCIVTQLLLPEKISGFLILGSSYRLYPYIKNILAPGVADPHGTWHSCKLDINSCSPSQLDIMQEFRLEFLSALTPAVSSLARGLFINSCYAHCQTEMQETWLRDDSPLLNDKTIAKAVGDWFYDRSPFQKIDCPYPCDKTCHNRVFDPKEHPTI